MDKATEVITPEVLVQLLQELQAMESGNPADFGPGAQARTQPQPQIQPQPQPQPQPGSFEGAFPRGGNIPLQPAQQTQSPSPMQSAQPSPEELYGIQQQGDPGIAQLMKLLEGAKMPIPERPKQSNETLRMIAGSLGDAAMAMSNLRLGHPAGQGAFAQSRQLTEDRYQKQLAEATRFNSELGAKARLMMFDNKLQMRRDRDKPVKPANMQLTKLSVPGPGGSEIEIPMNYNPEEGTITPTNLKGYEAFQKSPILPGSITGSDGKMRIGFVQIDPSTGVGRFVEGEAGEQVAPKPEMGFQEGISGQKAMFDSVPGLKGIWTAAHKSLGGNEGVINYVQNYLQNLSAPTTLFKKLAPPELVNYYRDMRATLFPYIKSISGAAFPEQELQRYESQFPVPGIDSEETAGYAWDVIIRMIARDMAAKYDANGRIRPEWLRDEEIRNMEIRNDSAEVDEPPEIQKLRGLE